MFIELYCAKINYEINEKNILNCGIKTVDYFGRSEYQVVADGSRSPMGHIISVG